MELLGLIEQIDSGDLNLLVVVKMSQLRGEILALLGRLDDAEALLSTALELSEKTCRIAHPSRNSLFHGGRESQTREERCIAYSAQKSTHALHFS